MGKELKKHKPAIEKTSIPEERFYSIFDNAVEGIFLTTPEGRFIKVNPAMARIHGFSSPEEMVTTITNIGEQIYVHPEERERYRAILVEKGVVKGFEAQVYKKDGTIIWTSTSARAIRDESGNVINFEGFVEDITERKKAEILLKEEKDKFSILIDNAPFGMALIDKDERFLYVNPKFIEIFGYDLSDTPDGKTWFKKAYPDPEYRHMVIDAWIKDMEKAKVGEQRPRIFNVVCKDGTKKTISFVPVQLESGLQIVSFEDITFRIRAQENLEQAMKKMRQSLIGTIQIISMIIEARDPYTAGHQKRVSALARALAQGLGLSADSVENIRMAGIIHDIGKISVPAEILSKPGILSELEMSLIKTHPESGYNILKEAELPYPIAEVVLQHHERIDGSGYPQGLKGDEVLFEAKIVAVADVVEAISSYRPYRPANGIEIALKEIEKNKGKLYDEKVVEACLDLFLNKKYKL
ncbi:MAG: PAS domain S-box protein [Syntrophorhabdaceae bacterium]|nr:PAS domain S-box protein [Syntrophorhabdaceae bacterium]